MIFARGARIPAGGRAGKVSILDITPTILAWLGLPVADDMDGSVAPFLSGPTPLRIATYDEGRIERRAEASGGADEHLEQQLRSLGYLD